MSNDTVSEYHNLLHFMSKKHTAALEMCHNQPLARDKPFETPVSVKLIYYVFFFSD